MCSVLTIRRRKEPALLSRPVHTSHAHVSESCAVWQEWKSIWKLNWKCLCLEICLCSVSSGWEGGWALWYLGSLWSQVSVQKWCRGSRSPEPTTSGTQSRPSRPARPSLRAKAPLQGAQPPWRVTASSPPSLPTRVPISANNNIHANRFLDHSRQNTRGSWQGRLPLCHHPGHRLGPQPEVLAIPSFMSALHTAESSCDFKLSFNGVDWRKRSCHHGVCF